MANIKRLDNKVVKAKLVNFLSMYVLPNEVQEFIITRCRNGNGNDGIKSKHVFGCLQSLDEITSKSVGEHINGKVAYYNGTPLEKLIGKRQIENYAAVIRTCSTYLLHTDLDIDTEPSIEEMKATRGCYVGGMTRDFTEEEREIIRYYSIHGTLDEVDTFVQEVVAGTAAMFCPLYPQKGAPAKSKYRKHTGQPSTFIREISHMVEVEHWSDEPYMKGNIDLGDLGDLGV